MDNKEAIQAANREFYRAIEAGAIERMDAVWAHTDEVRCIHPGWDLLIGWARVRESWEEIFDSDQRMRIQPSEVRISSADNFAWVTCVENITVFQEDSFDTVQAAATNLFIRHDDHWLLVHHHASPIPMIVPDSASETIQ
jgi:ketosteroid isomerase-like protein